MTERLRLSHVTPGYTGRAHTHQLSVYVLGFLACITLHPAALYAADSRLDQPFYSQNRSPLKQLLTPLPLQFYDPMATSSFSVQHSVYSMSQQAQSTHNTLSERLLLDGEIQRTDLTWHRQLFENTSLSVNLPWIQHNGGNLDSLIETWHDWFGLPNSNRDSRPQDALLYRYERDQLNLLEFSQSARGVGDIALALHYSLSHSPTQNYQLDMGVSLPTGDEHKLTGANTSSLWIQFATRHLKTAFSERVGWFASAAVMAYEHTGLLKPLREDLGWFGQAGVIWRWNDTLALKTQIELQSQLFESHVEGLAGSSAQLSSGLSWALDRQWLLDIYFTEDIDVSTAPDFGLGLRLQYRH